MRTLRDLLTTWENWSARDSLARGLERAGTEEAREALRRGLDEAPEVSPLDALRDAAELVALLSGWQWQTMHAARLAGSSWEEIGTALGLTGENARTRFVEALARQEAVRPGSTTSFRAAI